MKCFYLEENARGYPLSCKISLLDDGMHVLLVGGCSTHIGSISVAEPGQEMCSTRYPGHKDHVVGDKWARTLADKRSGRTVVVCGIHYDNLSAEDISEIVALTDRMLEELISLLNYSS